MNLKNEVRQRLDRARKLMSDRGYMALVLASGDNIQYLTGVEEPSVHTCGVAIVPRQGPPVLAVMWLDREAARQEAEEINVQAYTPDNRGSVVVKTLDRLGVTKGVVGMDGPALLGLRSIPRSLPDTDCVDASNAVEELRWVKSEEEIRLIRKACEIADEGMQVALESVEPGMTENQVAARAEQHMVNLGSDNKMKHATFVASGHRVGLVHPEASHKTIAGGELVALDLGAVYQGYCSDLARTCLVGQPTTALEEDFDVLREAQDAVLRTLRPGTSMQEIEAVTNQVTAAAGCQLIGHVGHSIGLKVEEHPRLRTMRTPYPEVKLKPNMVLAFFQSMLHSQRSLGIRLEDTVLVTDSGTTLLTKYPRKLFSSHA